MADAQSSLYNAEGVEGRDLARWDIPPSGDAHCRRYLPDAF